VAVTEVHAGVYVRDCPVVVGDGYFKESLVIPKPT
jgi:hypothetical protein